jgi:hypothetical protein
MKRSFNEQAAWTFSRLGEKDWYGLSKGDQYSLRLRSCPIIFYGFPSHKLRLAEWRLFQWKKSLKFVFFNGELHPHA